MSNEIDTAREIAARNKYIDPEPFGWSALTLRTCAIHYHGGEMPDPEAATATQRGTLWLKERRF